MTRDAWNENVKGPGSVPPKPCNFRWPISTCKYMRPVENDRSLTHEHYACAVCGKRDSLDYDEMR